jgi:hypothetical protein
MRFGQQIDIAGSREIEGVFVIADQVFGFAECEVTSAHGAAKDVLIGSKEFECGVGSCHVLFYHKDHKEGTEITEKRIIYYLLSLATSVPSKKIYRYSPIN